MRFEPIAPALDAAYRAAQALDPLDADAPLLGELPARNAAGDAPWLQATLAALTRRAEARAPEGAAAWAALRDLGFALGALARWGVSPTEAVPRLDATLRRCAAEAGCAHPRDNVFTLTVANPEGARMRTYTGAPSERAFIDAVGRSIRAMDRAIDRLAAAAGAALGAEEFAAALDAAGGELRVVVDALVGVRSRVDARWFAEDFVRNLTPVRVGGVERHGPSADQSPMLVVDWLLYGARDEGSAAVYERLSPHLRAAHRALVAAHRAAGGDDLVSRAARELPEARRRSPEAAARAVGALRGVLLRVKSFRYPHRKVAMESFARRGPAHQVGSGGLSPDGDLRAWILRTEAALARLDRAAAG